jgi:formamidopyrimidine-DNA glycosylase
VPELPEVETIRQDLDRELSGRRIRRVEAVAGRSIRRHPDATQFVAALVGATVQRVARRGKYLLFPLDRGGMLVVHLGMSGQLLVTDPGALVAPHTHVTVSFDGDRQLRFVDPRTFGEVFVAAGEGSGEEAGDGAGEGGAGGPWTQTNGTVVVAELAHLGADPLVDLKNWSQLADLLHARRARLKTLLMDQRFLAGIGNLYADEILFAARLRYDRASDSLTAPEVRRLHRAMTETLQSAIRHRGSSLADEQYRDVYGVIGGFQSRHQVYAREGQECPRCRQPIVRLKTGGRSTFLCPRCQT